jgi:hypothetical protein
MTKETPVTIDQITIETLRILETDLAFKRNMTRRDDENDSSPMRIRMPQVTYTPPPPKTPWLALAAFGLVATGFFMGVWAALAWAFLL